MRGREQVDHGAAPDSSLVAHERREIPESLGGVQLPKAKRTPRDLQVGGRLRGYLEENAIVGTSFVELAR